MEVGATWSVAGDAPTAADDALVGRVTGWPADPAVGPSPLRWARVVMAGVNAVVAAAGEVDPLSLRLVDAWLQVAPGPDRAPAWVDRAEPGRRVAAEARLREVVDLGALTGLRIDVAVAAEDGAGLARAGLTLAGRGAGLAGGTRPGPPDGPSPPPAGASDAALERQVEVGDEAVAGFSAWVGDPTPIHADREAAAAAGLRGPIAPGLFVLGVLATHAAEAARLAVTGVGARFVRPAVVGDELTVGVGAAAPGAGPRLRATAVGPEGPVVRRAWVELGGPGGSDPPGTLR